MRKFSFIVRTASLLVVGGLGMGVAPAGLVAQRQTTASELLLILPPMPADHADSAYVIQLTQEVRDRLVGRVRRDARVVTNEQYCDALAQSGFPCGTLLDDVMATQLATALNADAFVTGFFSRGADGPVVQARIRDIGRSGIAGWFNADALPGEDAVEDLAKVITDSLRAQVQASRDARDCGLRRDRSDFDGARVRAERVFVNYPNHPSAAQCVAYVFEATQQPVDSVIWAYRKMVEGDSLLSNIWGRLGPLYLQVNDTLAAVDAFDHQLAADPSNRALRIQVAQMWEQVGEAEAAVQRLEIGLELEPGNRDLLAHKVRICMGAEMWDCALNAFITTYESDPEMANDSSFFMQVIGVADVGADTVALLRWTEEAVERFPESVRFLGQRVSALGDAGEIEAALELYPRLNSVAPDDNRVLLGWARLLISNVQIDTAIPLDTASMMRADSLLVVALERAPEDPVIRRTAAFSYVTPGIALAQSGIRPDMAVRWLDQYLALDESGQALDQANFFYGLAAMYHLTAEYDAVVASESCERAEAFNQVAQHGLERMTVSGPVISEPYSKQVIPSLQRIAEAGAQMVGFYCANQ